MDQPAAVGRTGERQVAVEGVEVHVAGGRRGRADGQGAVQQLDIEVVAQGRDRAERHRPLY
jgi:hypothetical protein